MNFTLQRALLYRNRPATRGTVLRYGVLAATNWVVSTLIVTVALRLNVPPAGARLATILVLFVPIFLLSRHWVFRAATSR